MNNWWWLPNDCPMTAQWLPNDCPITDQWLPNDCPMIAQWLIDYCPMTAQWLPYDSPMTNWLLSNDWPITNWWWLPNDSQIIVWRLFNDFPMTDEIFLAYVENCHWTVFLAMFYMVSCFHFFTSYQNCMIDYIIWGWFLTKAAIVPLLAAVSKIYIPNSSFLHTNSQCVCSAFVK